MTTTTTTTECRARVVRTTVVRRRRSYDGRVCSGNTVTTIGRPPTGEDNGGGHRDGCIRTVGRPPICRRHAVGQPVGLRGARRRRSVTRHRRLTPHSTITTAAHRASACTHNTHTLALLSLAPGPGTICGRADHQAKALENEQLLLLLWNSCNIIYMIIIKFVVQVSVKHTDHDKPKYVLVNDIL